MFQENPPRSISNRAISTEKKGVKYHQIDGRHSHSIPVDIRYAARRHVFRASDRPHGVHPPGVRFLIPPARRHEQKTYIADSEPRTTWVANLSDARNLP